MAPFDDHAPAARTTLETMEALAQKILWLSTWTIHHANFVREKTDAVKVGGHQASCASSVSILTALYMHALRPQDRVAVKPHASPAFHAIQLSTQPNESSKSIR